MIPVLMEAALRSLLLGVGVVLALGVFRVRNVVAQKAAWSLVLLAALAMPLLLPVTARWQLLPAGLDIALPAHPMTLLEELQARILAKGGAGNSTPSLRAPAGAAAAGGQAAGSEDAPAPASGTTPDAPAPGPRSAPSHRASRARVSREGREASSAVSSSSSAPDYSHPALPHPVRPLPVRSFPAGTPPDPVRPAALPSAALLWTRNPVLALYCGVAAVLLLRLALGLLATIRLWRSAAPVPGHLLPADASALRVRATPRVASPLTLGTTILLPPDFADWDAEKMRIVLAHERSHIRQGDFLLQLVAGLHAALFWFSPLGWWLRHELAELAEVISDRAGVREARSHTSYAQLLLEFAARPRRLSMGVAMARSGSLSRRIERLLNDRAFRQCFAGRRRSLAAVALVPPALLVSATLGHVQARAVQAREAAPSPAPSAAGAPAPRATPELAAVSPIDLYPSVPAPVAIEPGDGEIPRPPAPPDPLPAPAASPEPVAPAPPAPPELPAPAAPAEALVLSPMPSMALGAGQQQGEGRLSFDRTLSASGVQQLSITAGAGNIHISRGSGSEVHVHGQIRLNRRWGGSEELARQIAANPPVEQDGAAIRVGSHQGQWNGISIDYEVQAPSGMVLAAISGSGNIVDEGVGRNARLETGSGNIQAGGLEGPFTVKTGSGNIVAAQSGPGDVVAETGSGDAELREIRGGLRVRTGSGDIKASGTPASSWTLQTGSGDVELWTGGAPLTLDASTGSGSVTTDREMMTRGSLDHHHIRGTLNGGGPVLRVETGSGDIRLH